MHPVSPISQKTNGRFIPGIGFILLYALLIGLSLWSWNKWNEVWVERSAGFFPPEFQESPEAVARMAWEYPIYRSNDSYQWVALADALARGENHYLKHRPDEGPPGGRPNAWHSGLARLLHASGSLVAEAKDWPTERGIHFTAHWLGAVLHLVVIAIGYLMMRRLAGEGAALFFALLYFFNAAILWDFAFSRLDHESLFQAGLLIQVLGLFGILQSDSPIRYLQSSWSLAAGIGGALCWWVGSTMQAVVGVLLLIGLVAQACLDQRSSIERERCARSLLAWGGIAAALMFLLGLIDGRLALIPSISALHPVWIVAQIGLALTAAALWLPPGNHRKLSAGLGLLTGLAPALWIAVFGTEAHTWLDPVIRRLHDYIVEFQSPFENGMWRSSLFGHTVLVCLALGVAASARKRINPLGITLITGLLFLSLFQTRWLGLTAGCATATLCWMLSRRKPAMWAICLLAATFILSWMWQWIRIEENPGKAFVTDMILQVGARDIHLNLAAYAHGEPVNVAEPFAFAPTAALFENIRPLGTFYWENRHGIEAASIIYASSEPTGAENLLESSQIDYVVVQRDQMGAPFAALAAWSALGTEDPDELNASLAWRLATRQQVPANMRELPFAGTFDPAKFGVRIFRVE